jgi:hypothetical protein
MISLTELCHASYFYCRDGTLRPTTAMPKSVTESLNRSASERSSIPALYPLAVHRSLGCDMHQPVEGPTPEALADLVARCKQINRYAVQLTVAEEGRIAALASGLVTMRKVLELRPIAAERLPPRQGRIQHWALAGGHLADLATTAIRSLHGLLVLDEHEQIKILSHRTWRGGWRQVTLWRDGVHGISAHDLMAYLARLTAEAQERAPGAARTLLERSQAVARTHALLPDGPRSRAD